MDLREKKVFIGLSGGVDSALAATLLKEAGADVYGVFIKGWYPPGLPCTWAEDRKDAMRVAAYLGIPFATLDGSEAYKKYVIDYMLAEYKAGRTPNPDIMCNKEVKFGVFYDFAKKHRADFLATGHYARSENAVLMRGVDEEKDQSYFLWAITPEALAMTLFPLGGLRKEEVRQKARACGLPNSEKKDSQGICFLGPVSMDDFLRSEMAHETGNAVAHDGSAVGTHDGVLLYTLGERIAPGGAAPGPWYVVAKDIPKNELLVSKERKLLTSSECVPLHLVNWFAKPTIDQYVSVQYRYHGPRVAGYVRGDTFVPDSPIEEPVASGQSIVFYDGDVVLGGAIVG